MYTYFHESKTCNNMWKHKNIAWAWNFLLNEPFINFSRILALHITTSAWIYLPLLFFHFCIHLFDINCLFYYHFSLSPSIIFFCSLHLFTYLALLFCICQSPSTIDLYRYLYNISYSPLHSAISLVWSFIDNPSKTCVPNPFWSLD